MLNTAHESFIRPARENFLSYQVLLILATRFLQLLGSVPEWLAVTTQTQTRTRCDDDDVSLYFGRS